VDRVTAFREFFAKFRANNSAATVGGINRYANVHNKKMVFGLRALGLVFLWLS